MLIIFDLDDTLIDTTESITINRLQYAFEAMIRAGFQVEDEDEAKEALERLDRTSTSGLQTLEEFIALYEPERLDTFFSIGKSILSSSIQENEIVSLFHGVDRLLIDLSQLAHLAIVTRGKEASQHEKMKISGLPYPLFSKILVTQSSKKESYDRLIKDFNLIPDRVIVVGDRIEVDLVPAKELGCTTVWVHQGRAFGNMVGSFIVDYQIDDILDLQSIVEERC